MFWFLRYSAGLSAINWAPVRKSFFSRRVCPDEFRGSIRSNEGTDVVGTESIFFSERSGGALALDLP